MSIIKRKEIIIIIDIIFIISVSIISGFNDVFLYRSVIPFCTVMMTPQARLRVRLQIRFSQSFMKAHEVREHIFESLIKNWLVIYIYILITRIYISEFYMLS